MISGVEDDYTVDCPDELVWSEPTATDTCDGDVYGGAITFNCSFELEGALVSLDHTFTATGEDEFGYTTYSETNLIVEQNGEYVIDLGPIYLVPSKGGGYDVYNDEVGYLYYSDQSNPYEASCDASEWTVYSELCEINGVTCGLPYEDVADLDDCGLGTVTRTWTATDCAGNSSTASQTITIQDITAPVIEGVDDDYTVECPEDLVWSEPTATDACSGDTITFNCSFEFEGALVSLDHTFTATGEDEFGYTTYSETNLIVEQNGEEVTDLGPLYLRSWEVGYEVYNDEVGYLYYSEQSNPYEVSCDASEWYVYNAPCEIFDISCTSGTELTYTDSDTLDACGLGTVTRTWTATDCAGNSSTDSQTITIEDNTAPVISGVEESFTVECPDDYMFSEPTVSDTCDGGVQTSNQIVDVNAGSTWFAFMQWYDSNPDFNGNAPWGVSDAVAIPNVDDNTVTLKPNRVNDLASYWINDPADTFGRKTMVAATYVEDNSLVATAFNYAGNVSDYTLDGDYSVNVFIKVFQANFQNALVLSKPISSEGDFSITYDGAYEGAAIVQYGFEMTGANVNPLADFDAVYNALGSVVVTATSNELTLTYEDDDKTDECGLGTITRTWTATDCAGNESTASQTITIEDNVDPYFNEELPQDITNVDCESVPEAAVLTASDACDQDIKVDFEQVRDDGNCAGNYTLTRTWSASDCAGNSIEHVQVIHVTDTTPPVLVGDLPESMNELNACQGAYMDAPLSEEEFALLFTDNCSDVVVSLDTSAVGDDCGWSVMHKYAVSDDCGNSLGNFKVYYSGSDMTAPELMEAPADVTVSCDDVPEADDLMAMDDCKGDFSVKAVDTVQSVGDEACGNYDITRTWTAVDNCGNETVHTQVIQVRDMEAPELTGDLPEGTNENDACAPESDEELAALGVLTASEFAALYTDDCNTVVVNREHNIDGDDCKWIMWVRYDVSDSCGNEAQSVKLWYHGGDATAPEITKAEDVTEECDGTDDALNAWLADNGGNTATDCGEFTWTNDYDSRASTEGDGCTTVTTVTFTATDACGN